MSERDAYDALVLATSENGCVSVTVIDAIVAYANAVRADEKERCIAAVEGPLDNEGSGALYRAVVEAIRNA